MDRALDRASVRSAMLRTTVPLRSTSERALWIVAWTRLIGTARTLSVTSSSTTGRDATQ